MHGPRPGRRADILGEGHGATYMVSCSGGQEIPGSVIAALLRCGATVRTRIGASCDQGHRPIAESGPPQGSILPGGLGALCRRQTRDIANRPSRLPTARTGTGLPKNAVNDLRRATKVRAPPRSAARNRERNQHPIVGNVCVRLKKSGQDL